MSSGTSVGLCHCSSSFSDDRLVRVRRAVFFVVVLSAACWFSSLAFSSAVSSPDHSSSAAASSFFLRQEPDLERAGEFFRADVSRGFESRGSVRARRSCCARRRLHSNRSGKLSRPTARGVFPQRPFGRTASEGSSRSLAHDEFHEIFLVRQRDVGAVHIGQPFVQSVGDREMRLGFACRKNLDGRSSPAARDVPVRPARSDDSLRAWR